MIHCRCNHIAWRHIIFKCDSTVDSDPVQVVLGDEHVAGEMTGRIHLEPQGSMTTAGGSCRDIDDIVYKLVVKEIEVGGIRISDGHASRQDIALGCDILTAVYRECRSEVSAAHIASYISNRGYCIGKDDLKRINEYL